uniref:Homeobox domain-containing protein n=1 Tax=Glossina brevipalpis TaxID=37001 RepID=A0A1A9W4N2_9MUSC
MRVKIWFQNRRMKWRNSKERELLASGGSRDQTLPNKNNPNPDLSDAKCDRPITPLSPGSVSPNRQSVSPSNSVNAKEEITNGQQHQQHSPENQSSSNINTVKPLSSPKTPSSPPIMHHIPQPVTSIGLPPYSAQNMQISSPPPPLLTMAKLPNTMSTSINNINNNNNDQSSATSSPPSCSTAAVTAASSNGAGGGGSGGNVNIVMPMTNAEFQAKINAEMHKHLMAADLKFKLESTLNEAKQRRLSMLSISAGDNITLHSAASLSGSNLFISNAMQEALNHQHQLQQQHLHNSIQSLSNGPPPQPPPPPPATAPSPSCHQFPQSAQNYHHFQNSDFMKMYYDDYDESNSDSDEEISVT